MLEETSSQNYRIRHLLQRVCASIRDYDSVQTSLAGLLGMPYTKLPPDVLDAFVHDPSAVTGSTRRTKGWRAVEDIHSRIGRQRETLRSFILSQHLDSEPIVPPHKVFDDPIAQLMSALDQLASQRIELAHKAEEVGEVLKQVKTVQASVKKDYNDTLAYTSLVYPEVYGSFSWSHTRDLTTSLAIPNCCPRGELSQPVPAVLGHRLRSAHASPRHGDAVLAQLRQGYR